MNDPQLHSYRISRQWSGPYFSERLGETIFLNVPYKQAFCTSETLDVLCVAPSFLRFCRISLCYQISKASFKICLVIHRAILSCLYPLLVTKIPLGIGFGWKGGTSFNLSINIMCPLSLFWLHLSSKNRKHLRCLYFKTGNSSVLQCLKQDPNFPEEVGEEEVFQSGGLIQPQFAFIILQRMGPHRNPWKVCRAMKGAASSIFRRILMDHALMTYNVSCPFTSELIVQ